LRFNIVHVQPPGIDATMGHHDIARLLFFSFESLGYEVTIRINKIDPKATNIIVGYERLASIPPVSVASCILYQLEQLGTREDSIPENIREIYRGAKEVWDYDPHNIEVLKSIGITNVKFLPLAYHQKLATIPRTLEDIDVLFYGIMTDRRRMIIEELRPKVRTLALEYVYGQDRDNWIARSKIVLNIHQYETQLAEQVRVSYLLNNAKCVVSEKSQWEPLGQWCALTPFEGLVDTCLTLVADNAQRERIITEAHEGYGRTSMVENLRKVLESESPPVDINAPV
jgi:hypothetical protein